MQTMGARRIGNDMPTDEREQSPNATNNSAPPPELDDTSVQQEGVSAKYTVTSRTSVSPKCLKRPVFVMTVGRVIFTLALVIAGIVGGYYIGRRAGEAKTLRTAEDSAYETWSGIEGPVEFALGNRAVGGRSLKDEAVSAGLNVERTLCVADSEGVMCTDEQSLCQVRSSGWRCTDIHADRRELRDHSNDLKVHLVTQDEDNSFKASLRTQEGNMLNFWGCEPSYSCYVYDNRDKIKGLNVHAQRGYVSSAWCNTVGWFCNHLDSTMFYTVKAGSWTQDDIFTVFAGYRWGHMYSHSVVVTVSLPSKDVSLDDTQYARNCETKSAYWFSGSGGRHAKCTIDLQAIGWNHFSVRLPKTSTALVTT